MRIEEAMFADGDSATAAVAARELEAPGRRRCPQGVS